MKNPILIVGGYGVVGLQIAEIIRKAHPDLPLILGGRTLQSANEVAEKLGNATGMAIDVLSPDPLSDLDFELGAILAVVNDPKDALLRSAIDGDIPYIDITRWTERLNAAIHAASVLDIGSSISFSSSWMAGISAIVAKAATADLAEVHNIETSILFRLADKAGPNSVEYADRFGIPFRVMKNGEWKLARPVSDGIKVEFPSGENFKVVRFDEPSQETLAIYLGAQSASSRIGYDDTSTMGLMSMLVGSGIWKLISGPAFTKFRHSMLYNPGEGASHEIVITADGVDSLGKAKQVRATINDPEGQTHLTALGAYVQLQEALGLDGRPKRNSGVYLPENHTDPQFVVDLVRQHGVDIVIG